MLRPLPRVISDDWSHVGALERKTGVAPIGLAFDVLEHLGVAQRLELSGRDGKTSGA